MQSTIEDGERQLMPEINHRYSSASSAQPTPSSYPWGYFENNPSLMYPAQLNYRESVLTGDRFRGSPPLLKGKMEVSTFVFLQSVPFSATFAKLQVSHLPF